MPRESTPLYLLTGPYEDRGAVVAFAAPLHPLSAIVFLTYVLMVLALLAAASPVQASLGLEAVGIGIPVYYLIRRRR